MLFGRRSAVAERSHIKTGNTSGAVVVVFAFGVCVSVCACVCVCALMFTTTLL